MMGEKPGTEEKMEEGKSEAMIISQILSTYESKGFSDKVVKLAKDDLESGVDKELVDCYMKKKLKDHQIEDLRKQLHDGMSLELGELIAKRDLSSVETILKYLKERIPFEKVAEIMDSYNSAHHLKVAFEDFKKEVKKIKLEPPKEEKNKEPQEEAKQEEPKQAETPAPTPAPEPVQVIQAPVQQAPIPQPTVQPAPVYIQVPTPVKEPVQEAPAAKENGFAEYATVFTSAMKDILHDITEKNTDMIERVMSASEEKSLKMLDTYLKNSNQKPIEVHVPAPEVKQIEPTVQAPTPIRDQISEPTQAQSAPQPQQAVTPNPQTEVGQKRPFEDKPSQSDLSGHNTSEPSGRADIDGVTRMIMMPDGEVYPVFVEHTKKKQPKGFFGLASRLFGKDSKQNALLRQLIDGRLKTDQIQMIRRAVKSHLPDEDIKDLINSNLPAQEMDSIIDVVLADRHSRMGVV